MEREKYLDILRVIAMFAVIFNHSWGYFSCDNYELYSGTLIYYIDVLLNTLTRIDVPIFLMVSGYLMLKSKKYSSIRECMKKWGGVLKLICIWIILYTIGHVFLLQDIDVITGIKSLIHGVAGGYYYYNHLWYLYVTICLYMLNPLLQIVIQNKKNLDYILIIWVAYSVIVPIVTHYVKVLELNTYCNMNFLGGYIGYYLLGYKLGTMNARKRKWGLLFVSTWILTSAVCILNMKYYNGDTVWQDFMSPGIIFMAIFMFIAVKQKNIKDDSYYSLIKAISGVSLGVYLVHYFVRDFLMAVYWQYIKIEWLYMIFEPFAVGAVTILIVVLLSQIKWIRRYLLSI